MKTIANYSRLLAGIFFFGCLMLPSQAKASLIVESGFDLFTTVTPGTTFGGFEFMGVPLGPFDFGTGPINVGNTDTIVKRLEQADGGGGTSGSDTIDIEIVALQLRSVDIIDLGAGLNYYYATLSTTQQSLGKMTINFDNMLGGTFDTSFFDVFFDIRLGSLSGAIVASNMINLNSSGNQWGRNAPTDAVKIPEINHMLNGNNTDHDFWSIGVVNHDGPHPVITADVPEPSTLLIFGLGLAVLGISQRKRSQQS
ncbi:MAG: PEP-CTERM sorting domain-containing protein [Colwellia sp.]|nr:PEP-CTERM sorting domain-containing protein [Colwellia sp.]